MSWITRHWDSHFISIATENIRGTVSQPVTQQHILTLDGQMVEYHEKVASATQQAMPPSNANATIERAKPMYMSLAAQYGLSDEMEIGGSNTPQQTIEQEYQAYITAPLSLTTTDVLKFWEVGGTRRTLTHADGTTQVNAASLPTLFAMAMDYLPIQASAVPCK